MDCLLGGSVVWSGVLDATLGGIGQRQRLCRFRALTAGIGLLACLKSRMSDGLGGRGYRGSRGLVVGWHRDC